MNGSVFTVRSKTTSRKTVRSSHTVPSAGQEAMYQQNVLLNTRTMDQLMKAMNFKRKEGAKAMKLTERNGKEHRINHNFCIKTTDVLTVQVITKLMIALQDDNTRLPPLATLPVVQVFTHTIIYLQTHHLNTVHIHSNTPNKVSLLLG